jgi:hypothetical protein
LFLFIFEIVVMDAKTVECFYNHRATPTKGFEFWREIYSSPG